MAYQKTISTRDKDAIEVVETFRHRKGYPTYSEALEKLIQRAKEAGLHLQDRPAPQPQPAASS